MKTREEALEYGLSFPDTYTEMPFHDPNWQLVRVKGSKKAFLWTYEKDGCLHLNVKTDPAWRDFWRSTFSSVIPAYHQNKEHWNTIILDGTIPDEDIRRMIAQNRIADAPALIGLQDVKIHDLRDSGACERACLRLRHQRRITHGMAVHIGYIDLPFPGLLLGKIPVQGVQPPVPALRSQLLCQL